MSAVPALSYRGVGFSYAAAPGAPASGEVLRDVTLEVPEGEFVLLVGATGSGKSTLLRLAKPEIAPAGRLEGEVRAFGEDVRGLGPVESARAVGYVFQDPDAQIVCDTVWHEVAFGLENLGVDEGEMRRRVAETCNFLGMEPWLRARTAELSGGQRQTLALAATLALRPRLLLLDEPTAMLDPLAEKSFLSLLFRANRELGMTVVVATHAPRPMLDYATSALRIEGGAVLPTGLGELAKAPGLEPVPRRGDSAVCGDPAFRSVVRDDSAACGNPASRAAAGPRSAAASRAIGEKDLLRAENLWLRYSRDGRWVLRGLDLSVAAGEVRVLVGSNGCGKSTLLAALAGVLRTQRGRVHNEAAASQALLPQSPRALLARETVADELSEWRRAGSYDAAEVSAALGRVGLAGAAERHPYDLSGGQQQLLALEKLLLLRPRLLLLDEPTKGLDDAFRAQVAVRVAAARDAGATVLVATHDLGFVRAVADSVSLLFDGEVAVTEPTATFFERSWLYRDR